MPKNYFGRLRKLSTMISKIIATVLVLIMSLSCIALYGTQVAVVAAANLQNCINPGLQAALHSNNRLIYGREKERLLNLGECFEGRCLVEEHFKNSRIKQGFDINKDNITDYWEIWEAIQVDQKFRFVMIYKSGMRYII